MAISYLEGITRMEITPAPSARKDVLFEMVTSEFTNECCRVYSSYDLVVKEFDSDVILFCINGAEIKNHPVKVYANEPIGWIEDEKIQFSSSGLKAVQITGSQGRYDFCGIVVRVSPGLVNIYWPRNASNEMKVMTIAFAIHMSMTKHKTTVMKDVSTARKQRKTYQLVDLHKHIDAPVIPEVKPQENRTHARSMFPRSTQDQNVWLTMIGEDPKTKQKLAFLMNEYGKVLLIIEKDEINEFNVHKTVVRKIDGVAEFNMYTTYHQDINLVLCDVGLRGRSIGQVKYNGLIKQYTLTDRTGSGIINVISSTLMDPMNPYSVEALFYDCDGNFFGRLNKQNYTTLEICLFAGVPPVMKKLILCAAIVFYGSYFKHFEKCPQVTVKPQTCKCNQCLQRGQISVPYHLPHDHKIFNCVDLKIKLAGHTKTKNILYCDVFRQNGGEVLCTLEITPIKDFTGVAKVICKSRNGDTWFTSLHSPAKTLILIYNAEDILVGYVNTNRVCDWQNKMVLKIGSVMNKKESPFDLNDKYRLYRPNVGWISEISADFRCMTLRRHRTIAIGLSELELFAELTLAAIFQSKPYEIDRILTPEIVYCYES